MDIEIHTKEMLRVRDSLNKIISSHTSQEVKKVSRDTERDFILTAEQAKEYGIIDEIIYKK